MTYLRPLRWSSVKLGIEHGFAASQSSALTIYSYLFYAYMAQLVAGISLQVEVK